MKRRDFNSHNTKISYSALLLPTFLNNRSINSISLSFSHQTSVINDSHLLACDNFREIPFGFDKFGSWFSIDGVRIGWRHQIKWPIRGSQTANRFPVTSKTAVFKFSTMRPFSVLLHQAYHGPTFISLLLISKWCRILLKINHGREQDLLGCTFMFYIKTNGCV